MDCHYSSYALNMQKCQSICYSGAYISMADTEIEDKQLIVAPAVDANHSICSNCKAPLNGPYCAQCGQNSESTIKYFWLVILHLLDDIFSFDSRASRTLWPLVT
ncbi:MAG: hypothetical protein ACI9RV_002747, partial [Glaciecola sp.]